jgi:hypothetical protein
LRPTLPELNWIQENISETTSVLFSNFLSALYYPIGQRVVSPYLIGGFGWYKLNATAEIEIGLITIDESISLTESAPHIGAGLEIFVGDHFSAGSDVRKLFFEFETPFGDLTSDVLKYAYLVNIMANFYF